MRRHGSTAETRLSESALVSEEIRTPTYSFLLLACSGLDVKPPTPFWPNLSGGTRLYEWMSAVTSSLGTVQVDPAAGQICRISNNLVVTLFGSGQRISPLVVGTLTCKRL
jgi:hypothetical protein